MPKKPSQRRDPNAEQKKQENKEQIRKQRIQLMRDLSETFSTTAGRRTLRFLMEQCGYQKYNTFENGETGDLLVQSMLFNEARRGLYLDLRQFIPQEILIAVENQGLGDDPEEEIDIFS